jgi:hypothetical protein
MTGPDYRFGRPFDLLLLTGAQTESGRGLHDISDVAPVVAEALLVLSATPLREAATGLASNVFRRLEELTPRGEPTTWGSLGIVDWIFNGPDVAHYFAHSCAASLLDTWSRPADKAGLGERLRAAAHANHFADVDEFMRFAQEAEGRPRLGEYGKEVVRSLRGMKVKAKGLPDRLRTFEETFEQRMWTALKDAAASVGEAVSAYLESLDQEARASVDEGGPAAGHLLVDMAVDHAGDLQSTLEDQRNSLRESLAEAEGEMGKAFQALESSASRSRMGWLRGLKKPLAAYVAAATKAFKLRYAFDLTEAALAAISRVHQELKHMRLALQAMGENFALAQEGCRRWVVALESREPTPVEEIIQRPLYETDDLHRLYEQTYGAAWGAVTPELEAAVHQSAGGLSRWLGQKERAIYEELITALLSALAPTASMTADDFVHWLWERGELSPQGFLRDSEALATVLCRCDRARLPDGGDLDETTFRIVGVPDRERSVFAGMTDALVVSTGDQGRIIYLRLKLGFPSSSLWHYHRYEHAHQEIRRQGRVALRIYPDFPYDGRRDPPPDDKFGVGRGNRGPRPRPPKAAKGGRE